MIRRHVLVGHRQHGFQAAQHAVGAPVLGQLDGGAHQVALVLFQLGLEALEQREGVGRGAGKTGQHLLAVELAHLARAALTTMLPSVTWPSPPRATLRAAAHAEDGGAVVAFHGVFLSGGRWPAAIKAGRVDLNLAHLDLGVLVDAHGAEEQRHQAVRVDEVHGPVLARLGQHPVQQVAGGNEVHPDQPVHDTLTMGALPSSR
jgi:hypothetical protein